MISLSWRNWTTCLGLAGACLIFVGCGGSDLPNPEADGTAVAQADPTPQAEPAAQVAEGEPKAEEPSEPAPAAPTAKADAAPMPEVPAAVPDAAPKVAAATPVVAESPASTTPADAATQAAATPSDPAKADTGATTSEMLALAAGSSSTPPAGGTAPGAGGAPATPAPNTAGGPVSAKDRDNVITGNNSVVGTPSRRSARDDAGDMGNGGGAGGRIGGNRGGAANDGPADFRSAQGAVKAFLSALDAKDVDRLSEATALRSPYEAVASNRERFKKIVEGSITEAELNDLAEQLEKYTISGLARQVTSTGRQGVLVTKPAGTGSHQRTITARKEKAGWKVLDISPVTNFKGYARPFNPNRPSTARSN